MQNAEITPPPAATMPGKRAGTPAVVLWDAVKGQAIPIGYGVMSADELQDRIFLLTSKEAGRDY